uniref:Uncharacterized protein n=1 Tax=Timema genevievae TaxID=629358 RepID=A0A7R9K461_TIMGE|nr:unnamed protein product [Timema genevievae]
MCSSITSCLNVRLQSTASSISSSNSPSSRSMARAGCERVLTSRPDDLTRRRERGHTLGEIFRLIRETSLKTPCYSSKRPALSEDSPSLAVLAALHLTDPNINNNRGRRMACSSIEASFTWAYDSQHSPKFSHRLNFTQPVVTKMTPRDRPDRRKKYRTSGSQIQVVTTAGVTSRKHPMRLLYAVCCGRSRATPVTAPVYKLCGGMISQFRKYKFLPGYKSGLWSLSQKQLRSLAVNIEHVYLVKVQSYNICDRNFGLYSQRMKNKENTETANEYVDILKKCRNVPEPFQALSYVSEQKQAVQSERIGVMLLRGRIKEASNKMGYVDILCSQWVIWLLAPLLVTFLLPLIIVFLFYLTALILYIYKLHR